MRPRLASLVSLSLLLGACASRHGTPDNEPTLKTLAGRSAQLAPDTGLPTTEAQAIEAYQKFLDAAPRAQQRAEAMRRLGDLEMERAESRSAAVAGGAGAAPADPDYRLAVARYREFLQTYPHDPGRERVLYQLARAYEQGGDLPAALKTLDQLVQEHPSDRAADEVQFRRGELLFGARDYVGAEKAYATVLGVGSASPYHDRALYMQGWTQFKQGRLDDSLVSFFGVLDLKLGDTAGDAPLDAIPTMTRADRELVEDTFRVTSIALANTEGADAIGRHIDSPLRQSYEFRVYQQLGEFYLRQERFKDAADTFTAFARQRPAHAQAPVFQARVISIDEQNGFGNLALNAKRDYVARYGPAGEFSRANPTASEQARPLVKTYLAELAQHYHASAQKSHQSADYQEAVHWYRAYLEGFPKEPEAAHTNFLLAELLFEDHRWAEAAAEYGKTAYAYPSHAFAADAGYAALLCDAQLRRAASGEAQARLSRQAVADALRFARAFPSDARTGPVLADAADTLYALRDPSAAAVAQQVIDLVPAAAPAQRRAAWSVIAHAAFDDGAFARSELASGELLKLTPETDASRKDALEFQAAAIYKQGEAARSAGQTGEAVANFQRVASVAPQSAVRATAQYDAAAAQLALKDWQGATATLEDFRRRFPGHALQPEVGKKLAVAYLEQAQWSSAAAEFERLAGDAKDPALARNALWQAAQLFDKAGDRRAAARAYTHYLAQYPQALEPAEESRARLAEFARSEGDSARAASLSRELVQADQAGGAARTPRTRYLGAMAALTLAEPAAAAYRQVALVEPLQTQLKLKKARMEEALKAYQLAADYGVADASTRATFEIASLYGDFGQALIKSERPKKLSKAELEQYGVLLEEQAYPFEEKATAVHELNARRAADGLYDPWVRRSFDALRVLRPLRYGKNEKVEGVIDAIR